MTTFENFMKQTFATPWDEPFDWMTGDYQRGENEKVAQRASDRAFAQQKWLMQHGVGLRVKGAQEAGISPLAVLGGPSTPGPAAVVGQPGGSGAGKIASIAGMMSALKLNAAQANYYNALAEKARKPDIKGQDSAILESTITPKMDVPKRFAGDDYRWEKHGNVYKIGPVRSVSGAEEAPRSLARREERLHQISKTANLINKRKATSEVERRFKNMVREEMSYLPPPRKGYVWRYHVGLGGAIQVDWRKAPRGILIKDPIVGYGKQVKRYKIRGDGESYQIHDY